MRRLGLWTLPLLACLVLAVQAFGTVRYVQSHGGLHGVGDVVSGQAAREGHGPAPFGRGATLGPEAARLPALAGLADSVAALGDRLTEDQRSRLQPMAAALLRCRREEDAARADLLGVLGVRQLARLEAPPPPGAAPAPPTPGGDSPEAALARRLLESLAASGPGEPPGVVSPGLSSRPLVAVLEALEREAPALALSEAQVERLGPALRRILQAEQREEWLKERITEVFTPDQLAWLERRGPGLSPVRPLLRDWLARRAAERE